MTYLHLRFTDDNRKQNRLPFSMELTDEGVSINLIGQGIVEKYCLGRTQARMFLNTPNEH